MRYCCGPVSARILAQKLKSTLFEYEWFDMNCLLMFHFSFFMYVCRTPLHLAVCNGHEDVVKLLLEQKCDVNARDAVSISHWTNWNMKPNKIPTKIGIKFQNISKKNSHLKNFLIVFNKFYSFACSVAEIYATALGCRRGSSEYCEIIAEKWCQSACWVEGWRNTIRHSTTASSEWHISHDEHVQTSNQR